VESLEAALWAFHGSRDFRNGALLAVNLGDDADTTGAVYGQLTGAYHGVEAMPGFWRDRLSMRQRIEALADRLLDEQARAPSSGTNGSMLGGAISQPAARAHAAVSPQAPVPRDTASCSPLSLYILIFGHEEVVQAQMTTTAARSRQVNLLARIKALLQVPYGARLRGVVLYGSGARGETEADSDVDILVLLAGPVDLGKDLETIIRALYPLQLELDQVLEAFPVEEAQYLRGEYAWYRHA
jgi:predicted nucleotidyltransferase